jgi:hypothetical protein
VAGIIALTLVIHKCYKDHSEKRPSVKAYLKTTKSRKMERLTVVLVKEFEQ